MLAVIAAKLALDAHFASCAVCKPAIAAWRATLGTDAETDLQPAICDAGKALRQEHTRAMGKLPLRQLQAYIGVMLVLEGP